jgi:hypothetical protein
MIETVVLLPDNPPVPIAQRVGRAVLSRGMIAIKKASQREGIAVHLIVKRSGTQNP